MAFSSRLTTILCFSFSCFICWCALHISLRERYTSRQCIFGLVGEKLPDAITVTSSRGHTNQVSQPIANFPSFYRPTCKKLWRGDFSEESLIHNVSSKVVIVVSFCKGELDTLFRGVANLNIKRIVVYSKCTDLHTPAQFLKRFEGVSENNKAIVSLSNVGRVDHNIAHFIVNNSTFLDSDDIVLFVEDNYHIVHQMHMELVPFQDMVMVAAGEFGFACGLLPRLEKSSQGMKEAQFSTWHDTSTLISFTFDEYKSGAAQYFQNHSQAFSQGEIFGDWLKVVHIKLPTPITPVCYGGNFAVRSTHLQAARDAAANIEISLRRGDNIIEGHFAERTWAGILMSQIPKPLMQTLVYMHMNGTLSDSPRPGMFVGCAELKV
mmetsp:Transcript_8131/g.33969  ORF Transcript_8131/g.33969 Transcript_8131/m.33969 type:complete len:378 (+) Transcript_8131:345-1478(+)